MTSKYTHSWFVALSLAILAMTTFTSALADDVADVNKLIQHGQLPEAMQKANTFLAQHPKDAQMRFLKGLIFAEQSKPNDAITVFTKLTEDYPELPEPYNNLAVLFASTNQYDKARSALEMAIRTNPSYGTAHENLGDVYTKLASQAYDKALQLDSGNAGAKLKLTLIRNIFTKTNTHVAANSAPTQSPPAAATTAAATKTTANSPTSTTGAGPSVPTTIAGNTPAATKSAPAKTDAQKPASAKSEPKTIATQDEQNDVLKTVYAWATAWSNKDTAAYLTFYAKDFQLPKGATRKTWTEARRVRIEGKGRINVKIESPKIVINGNTATVRFRQIYNSDQLKADSNKTLVFNKLGGKWQITQERAGG